jgi:hypothetical protein
MRARANAAKGEKNAMTEKSFAQILATGTLEEIEAEIHLFRRTASDDGFKKMVMQALKAVWGRAPGPGPRDGRSPDRLAPVETSSCRR